MGDSLGNVLDFFAARRGFLQRGTCLTDHKENTTRYQYRMGSLLSIVREIGRKEASSE